MGVEVPGNDSRWPLISILELVAVPCVHEFGSLLRNRTLGDGRTLAGDSPWKEPAVEPVRVPMR